MPKAYGTAQALQALLGGVTQGGIAGKQQMFENQMRQQQMGMQAGQLGLQQARFGAQMRELTEGIAQDRQLQRAIGDVMGTPAYQEADAAGKLEMLVPPLLASPLGRKLGLGILGDQASAIQLAGGGGTPGGKWTYRSTVPGQGVLMTNPAGKPVLVSFQQLGAPDPNRTSMQEFVMQVKARNPYMESSDIVQMYTDMMNAVDEQFPSAAPGGSDLEGLW